MRRVLNVLLVLISGVFITGCFNRPAPFLNHPIYNSGETVEVFAGDFIWTFTSTDRISETWVYFDKSKDVRDFGCAHTGFMALSPDVYEHYLAVKNKQCCGPFLKYTVASLLIITDNQYVVDIIKKARRGDRIVLSGFNLTYKDWWYTGRAKYINKKVFYPRVIYVNHISKE